MNGKVNMTRKISYLGTITKILPPTLCNDLDRDVEGLDNGYVSWCTSLTSWTTNSNKKHHNHHLDRGLNPGYISLRHSCSAAFPFPPL